jgi:dihydrofolate reductase
MQFDIVVGVHASNWAIGAKGKIPWKCRTDMQFFKELTTSTRDPNKVNAVIMGRTTYESLGKPLANRVNVVLSKMPFLCSDNQVCFSSSFNEAVNMLDPNIETVFVIGGEMVYKQAITHPKCRRIYLNLIRVACDLSDADAFFPAIDLGIYELVETKAIDPSVTSHVFQRLAR